MAASKRKPASEIGERIASQAAAAKISKMAYQYSGREGEGSIRRQRAKP